MNQILNERELLYKYADEKWDELREILRELVAKGERLDQMERTLMTALMDLGRACLQDVIEAAGDGDEGETITRNGVTLKRSEKEHRCTYRSIFGPLEIQRFVYAIRERQKVQAMPLDEKLGLPADEISYVLEDWLGGLSANMPYDSAVAWLERTMGIKVGRTTAENHARKLGEYVDSYRRQRADPPSTEEGELMVVSADGKGLPIRRPLEQRLEEELGKKPHVRQRKTDYETSEHRRLRGDKSRTQRATVGACYSIQKDVRVVEDFLEREGRRENADVPRPQHKRLYAELTTIVNKTESRGAERIFQQLAAEVEQRNPTGNKAVFCIMDGDRSLWKLKEQYLPQAIGIIDLFHVMEKLWAAAHCFHPDASMEAEEFVHRYLKMLLEGKVDYVRGLFQRFLNQKKLNKTKKTTLSEVITYFKKNRAGMQYHQYLALGSPIGSGVIEGACKHVIGDRFCCSGMRWEIEGAQPLLNLRVTYLNDEWNDFVEYRIQAEQTALYTQAA